MSRPISKCKVRLTTQVTAASTTISFQATDSNRSLTSVAMSDFGTYGYLVINPSGKIGNYGIVRFESWSVSGSTITVGTLQWQTFQGNDASGTAVEFPAGTIAVVGNNHHWFNNVVRTEDAQTVAGVKTFSSFPITPSSAPSTDYQVANKKYVDDTAFAGAPNANTTTKGVVEQATLAETKAGTATGGTGAALFSNPADVAGAIQDSSWVYAADSVGTDSYAITLTPAPTAYTTGQKFVFKAGTANTGAATLNVNALGAKTIKKFNDQDLEDNDIESGQIVEVVYDGTNMQMVSPVASSLLQSNITNTEANTLTAGGSSNAESLHTHPLTQALQKTLGTDRLLDILLDANDRTFFTESGAGATISEGNLITQLRTGAVSGNNAIIYANNVIAGDTFITGNKWDKNVFFSLPVHYPDNTSQNAFFGLGSGVTVTGANGTDITRHIGFWIDDAIIYASNANGTTQTRTDVSTGITLAEYNTFQFQLTGGSNIKFYINGTLVATHTTNMPTGSSINFDPFFGIATATNALRNMNVMRKIRLLIESN